MLPPGETRGREGFVLKGVSIMPKCSFYSHKKAA